MSKGDRSSFLSKKFDWRGVRRGGNREGSLRDQGDPVCDGVTWDAGMWQGKTMSSGCYTRIFIWAGRSVESASSPQRSSQTLRKSAPTLRMCLPFITWRNLKPQKWSDLVPGPSSPRWCPWEKQPWCASLPVLSSCSPSDWLFLLHHMNILLQLLTWLQGFLSVKGVGGGGRVSQRAALPFPQRARGSVLSC